MGRPRRCDAGRRTAVDGMRFDSMARTLSASDSRRGAVKSLVALGVGLGLTRIGAVEAKNKGKSKKKGKKDLGDRCRKEYECRGNYECRNANSQNSCYASTEKRCCKKEGQPCDDGCECCGVDVIRNGGYCQSA